VAIVGRSNTCIRAAAGGNLRSERSLFRQDRIMRKPELRLLVEIVECLANDFAGIDRHFVGAPVESHALVFAQILRTPDQQQTAESLTWGNI